MIKSFKHLSIFIVTLLIIAALMGSTVLFSLDKASFRGSSGSSLGSSASSHSSSNGQFSIDQSIDTLPAASSSLQDSSANSFSVSQQLTSVPTSIPRNLGEATPIGPLSANEKLDLQFVLPLTDTANLDKFLSQAYDPASPLYHHFLSPTQFYSIYGPDLAEAKGLAAYLQSKGLQINIDATNPNTIEASGTASQLQNALNTQINCFRQDKQVFYSATFQAQLPRQFANIQMIYGLNNLTSPLGNTQAVPLYRTLGEVTADRASDSQYYEFSPVYYSPSEIRQAYNATSLLGAGYNGRGVSIAIIDAYGDPYIRQELQSFSAEFKLPFSNESLHIIPVGPYNPANGPKYGWSIEVALDVEWAHAMAPNATINLYVASDNANKLFQAVLNATLGSDGRTYGVYHNNIISLSWGMPENDIDSSSPLTATFGYSYPWLNQVFQMDAALGITVFASDGDWGAYDQSFGQTSPYGGASYPSTDPYVTGVGGTSLYMKATAGYLQWPYANATGTYGNETAWSWNAPIQLGTGGGWSTLFSQPSWQNGLGVVNNGERGNPDVAWDADPYTGVLVAVSSGGSCFYDIVGGTSVGAPCWAGAMALMDQKAGKSLGFVNPAIYSILNDQTKYSKTFHDIIVGNNNPYNTRKGWDPLTGIGSPNLGQLAGYLAPTGALPVIVTNDFSNTLGRAYAYGQVITLTATVANNRTITGPVTAAITSSTGARIASGIALAYSPQRGAWIGNYSIKAADPSGEWSVTVTANDGSYSGNGYTTLAVGDGVNILSPSLQTKHFYLVGDAVDIKAFIVDPSGTNVTTGVYTATLCLAQDQTTGNGFGKVEGTVTLHYDPSIRLWTGSFNLSSSTDQTAWVMVLNGTDLNGNKGMAYSWFNVGLLGTVSCSSAYVLGDYINVWAFPSYVNGSGVQTGQFTALLRCASSLVAKVSLALIWKVPPEWSGQFILSQNDPTGFYTIEVNGTDGRGNYGSFETVVHVAQYELNVQVSVPNPIMQANNGSEPWILAKASYPNGDPMTVGSVTGEIITPTGYYPATGNFIMTYNSSAGGFVTVNFIKENATTSLLWGIPTTLTNGSYQIFVQPCDAQGNLGLGSTTFLINGTNPPKPSLWSYETGRGIESRPMVDSGVVYIASDDGYLYALDAGTGALIWQYQTGNGQGSSPVISNGVVYVCGGGSLYALNATTGGLLWQAAHGAASPAVSGGIVYVAGSYDCIYAWNATTGGQIWRFVTNDATSVLSSPTVSNGIVYFGAGYEVYAIDAAAGKLLWRSRTGGLVFSTPAIAGDIVYVGSLDGCVYALNAATGAMIWQRQTLGFVWSSPTVDNGIVYIGSDDLNLYALNAATGAVIWTCFAWGDVRCRPAISQGTVFVSSGFSVFAISTSTGQILHEYETGGLTSSPAISNGIVYVGSSDDYIYAFSLSPYVFNVSVTPRLVQMDIGQSQIFVSTIAGGTYPFRYQWFLNGTAIPGATGPTWEFVPTLPCSCTICVAATDDTGAQAKSSNALAIAIAFSVSISPTSAVIDTDHCQLFNSTVSGGTSPYSYRWYLNDVAVSGATNSTWKFTPTHGGDFTASLRVTDKVGFKATSNLATVTVNEIKHSVAFNETDLPSDTPWSVTFNGQTQRSISNLITFNSINGVYAFFITPPVGFEASPSSGNIAVNGTDIIEHIVFQGSPVYDIAVTNVTLYKTIISQGYSAKIDVAVANLGTYTETFNVTLYANATVITTETITLETGNSTVLTFTWNTSGWAKSSYVISAYAKPVPNETNTIDNTFISALTIRVAMAGDVAGGPGSFPNTTPDGKVDIRDLAAIGKCYGANYPNPRYYPIYDLNDDQKIDIKDLAIAAMNYGKIDP